MKENKAIGLDFGVVKVMYKTNLFDQLRCHMEDQGYNVEDSDICSIRVQKSTDNKDTVLFKLVHYSVPTADTEPFFKIEFEYIMNKQKTLDELNDILYETIEDDEKREEVINDVFKKIIKSRRQENGAS